MLLQSGGVDVWYVDESQDSDIALVVGLPIPLLRNEDNTWKFVWRDHFDAMKDFRQRLAKSKFKIPARVELHGHKLASGRGAYFKGKHQFPRPTAAAAYRWILSNLGFLPPSALITVRALSTSKLYGNVRLRASTMAMFQRMQRTFKARHRNGIVFFDEGQPMYRDLYRQAQVYLPTGSSLGAWGHGRPTDNQPMDLFTKDANFKDSKHSWFVQAVDLMAYAALLKFRAEQNTLRQWQTQHGLATLYDVIPLAIKNTQATRYDPQGQGVVRLP